MPSPTVGAIKLIKLYIYSHICILLNVVIACFVDIQLKFAAFTVKIQIIETSCSDVTRVKEAFQR